MAPKLDGGEYQKRNLLYKMMWIYFDQNTICCNFDLFVGRLLLREVDRRLGARGTGLAVVLPILALCGDLSQGAEIPARYRMLGNREQT